MTGDGRYVTFFGDHHPSFAGNVVKAMASAKDGHPVVSAHAGQTAAAASPRTTGSCSPTLDQPTRAEVVGGRRLTHQIVEVVVRAPLAARNFHPGEFYRLQNYETFAEEVDGIKLTMEGIALTGAWVDRERGLISPSCWKWAARRLCSLLKPGEKVVLMGPTGHADRDPARPDRRPRRRRPGQRRALLHRPGACKAKNRKVIYFAGYKRRDRFKVAEIEEAATWWCGAWTRRRASRRPAAGSRPSSGNIVAGHASLCSRANSASKPIALLPTVDRIIAIGSDRMMAAVKAAPGTTC